MRLSNRSSEAILFVYVFLRFIECIRFVGLSFWSLAIESMRISFMLST